MMLPGAKEKDVLELELEQWREALETRGMKVSRAKTEYMCLNGTPLGSVNMQSAQLPQVTEFKRLGSTMQSDGHMHAVVNKRTQCGCGNWREMSVVLRDKMIPPQDHCSVRYYVREGTVPVTSAHANKLEVT